MSHDADDEAVNLLINDFNAILADETHHEEKENYSPPNELNEHEEDNKKVSLMDHIDMNELLTEDISRPLSKSIENKLNTTESPTIRPIQSASLTENHKNYAEEEKQKQGFYDVRIAVVGNVDAGKSSLIGVLTSGQQDNGRGLARSRVFQHKHEHENGRTSCISQHLVGYNSTNEPIYNTTPASSSAAVKTKAWSSVVSNSAHVVTFIDLAGHEKYLKTTIAGLTGTYCDYAIVVINSLAGITKMTKEHLGVVLALNIPLICVVTKVDLVPENVLARTKSQLFKVLKSPAAQKMPIQIKSSKDVNIAVENSSARICPVFFVSCVTGVHIGLLHELISKLTPRRTEWLQQIAAQSNEQMQRNHQSENNSATKGVEFMIDEVFNVTGVGVVVSGSILHGIMLPNTTLLLGPYSDGSFKQVYVRTLHYKRTQVESVEAGDSCAVSIRAIGRKEHITRALIRRGMALVDPILNPQATTIFECLVHILHHPTTIKLGYQCVIHCGMIRQAATIVSIDKPSLRTGDKALCRFRFLIRPEYLHNNTTFIFREGSTKGLGTVCKVSFSNEEMNSIAAEEAAERKLRKPISKQELHIINNINEKQKLELQQAGESETVPNNNPINNTINSNNNTNAAHT
jgi:small GTP-binding protein